MGQVFYQLYYHVVWATKHREPQLFNALRPALFDAIEEKCRRLGCRLHARNAVDDHVHLALEIPPARAVAFVVGQIKGATSHHVKQLHPGAIAWQGGYGAVTFRQGELARILQYIATQEERHRLGRLSRVLETWELVEAD